MLGNGSGITSGQSAMREVLGSLLRDPLAELGSAHPELDAGMTSSAVVGTLAAWLETGRRPSSEDVERAVAYCLSAVSPPG